MEQIIIGEQYEFYCEVQDDNLRSYTGQKVTVIANAEIHPDIGSLYTVRAGDNAEFDAWEEELNGWDKEHGQYFWPDGTYGPEHDETFLVNEK